MNGTMKIKRSSVGLLATLALTFASLVAMPTAANATLGCEENFRLTWADNALNCESIAVLDTLTLTVPSGVTKVQAVLFGGGGGGGAGGAHDNGSSISYYSGGGGGVGQISGMSATVAPGDVVTFTGGARGTRGLVAAQSGSDWIGSNGGDGGDSTLSITGSVTATYTAHGGKGGKSGTNGGAGGDSGDGLHPGGAGYNNVPGATLTAGGGGGGVAGDGVDGASLKGGDGGDTAYLYPQSYTGTPSLFPFFSSYSFSANTFFTGQIRVGVGGWIGQGGGGAVTSNTWCSNNAGRGGRINLSTSPSYTGFASCYDTAHSIANGKQNVNGLEVAGQGAMAGVGNASDTGDGLDGGYGYVWVRYVAQNASIAPNAPGTPTATAGNASASLSWAASTVGTAPITYTVTSSPAGASCTVSSLTASCTGLTNGTPYTFTITATNAFGNATSSSSSAVTPTPPPSTPNIQLHAGNGQIEVDVSDSGSGGAPTSYVVTASPGGATCTVIPSDTSCILSPLDNGTTYTVSVFARNGTGDSSAETGTATPSVASYIDGSSGSLPFGGSIDITTDAPAYSGYWMAGYIDGVYFGPSSTSASPMTMPWSTFAFVSSCAGGTITIYLFSPDYDINAIPNTANAIDSVAFTYGGDPSMCHSRSNSSGVYLPGTPNNSEFVVTHDTSSITIHSDYKGNYLYAPSKYTVTVSPGGKTCEIPTPYSSCVIYGLSPNIEYSLSITAENSVGTSAAFKWPTKYILSSSGIQHYAAQKAITNFAGDSAKLTAAFKISIAKFVKANPKLLAYTCTGYIAGASKTAASKGLAKARAKAVCGYIKKLKPKASITVVAATPLAKFNAKNRKVVIRGFASAF